jgi:uncharacterized protein YoaH (UPF0181 family)
VLPFSQTAWRFVGGLGTAYENVYWNLAWPWFGNGEDANVERAIRELLARGRGLAALACINSGIVHKLFISARVILDVLSEVRDELLRNEEQPEGQLFTDMDEYVLIEVLSSLQRMEGLTDEELSLGQSLEWSFMPLFKGGGSPELLLKKCSREPEFFVGILESTSWRDGVPKGMRTPRDEQQKARARNSNRLLKFFRRLPGVSSGGELEESAFVSWISEVRRLASQQDLRLSSDRFLGQLFLHSPSDPCGYWPWAPVCEFLSEPSAETVRRALSTAIFNNQGWPGPFGDGMTMSLVSERRKAVEKLKELASLLDFEFPTVAGLLRSQAEAQERSCERFDDEDD